LAITVSTSGPASVGATVAEAVKDGASVVNGAFVEDGTASVVDGTGVGGDVDAMGTGVPGGEVDATPPAARPMAPTKSNVVVDTVV